MENTDLLPASIHVSGYFTSMGYHLWPQILASFMEHVFKGQPLGPIPPLRLESDSHSLHWDVPSKAGVGACLQRAQESEGKPPAPAPVAAPGGTLSCCLGSTRKGPAGAGACDTEVPAPTGGAATLHPSFLPPSKTCWCPCWPNPGEAGGHQSHLWSPVPQGTPGI